MREIQENPGSFPYGSYYPTDLCSLRTNRGFWGMTSGLNPRLLSRAATTCSVSSLCSIARCA
jgi:hypothetical protein